jgi:hypothetical protein
MHGTDRNLRQPMNSEMNRVTKLSILQININKSLTAHLELINDSLVTHWDIVLIQEPYITYLKSIRTPNQFIPVTPTSHMEDSKLLVFITQVRICTQ